MNTYLRPFSLLSFLLLHLMSCSESKSPVEQLVNSPRQDEQREMAETSPFDDAPLNRLYAKLAPEPEVFEFTTQKPNTLKLKSEQQILIPAGAFVNEDGETPKSVKLEVTAATTPDQCLRLGLSSMSPDGFLQSDGMFFLKATSEGKELQVRAGSSLYIETTGRLGSSQTYYGTRKNGTVEWEFGDETSGEMIPIPAEDLFPSPFWLYYGPGIPDDFDYTPYKGTWILTSEFRDRTETLADLLGLLDAYINAKDTYGSDTLITDATQIYFDHTDLPLYQADLMVVAYLDSIMEVHAGGPYETSIQYWRQIFSDYALKKNTHVIRFDEVEIDWKAENAAEQLQEKYGLSEATAQRYVALHRQIPIYQEAMKKERDFFEENDRRKLKHFVPTTTVIGSMGWVNIDRLFIPSFAKAMDPKIRLADEASYDAVELMLVYPDRAAMIRSYTGKDGLRHFTKPQPGMDKLPNHERGILVAMGLKGDQSYLGIGYLKGEPNGVPEITLQPMSEQEIENKLAAEFRE